MRWYLVDRLIECDPGRSAVGIKTFSRSEVFFLDHFPGFPIVPGVLQIEMMATTGGKAIKLAQPNWLPILGQVKNAKFMRQVQPGDQCHIHVQVIRLKESYCVTEAYIEVDGLRVSQAQIFYAVLPATTMDTSHVDPVIQDWHRRQAQKETKRELSGTADLV